MDVRNKSGVDDAKLLIVEALERREGLAQEVVDCLVLGGINLELHHAFAPRNSIKNVGEEYVEADQLVINGNIRNGNDVLPLSMHMFSVDNRNKGDSVEGHVSNGDFH